MKKLLLATVCGLLSSPVWADNITATATVDGTLVATDNSGGTDTLTLGGVGFGVFNNNSVTATSQAGLASPGVLFTNDLSVQQTGTGSHELILDITATGLAGSTALTEFLSAFSTTSTEFTDGWSGTENTFINGVLLATSGLITPASSGLDVNSFATPGNPFTAEVQYIVDSVGPGQFNGGIDISTVAAAPGPTAGAGLPGLIAACFMILGLNWQRRRHQGLVA